MSLAVLRPLAFGEILDQAFGLFRRCFVPLVIISLACSGIPALLNLVLQAQGGAIASPVLGFIAVSLSLVGGAIANSASTFVVSEQYLGRNLEPGAALRRAVPLLGPILATTLTVGLLTGIGLILLIIPGIIAACGLSLAVTAATLEGLDSTKARNRSWELTKGYRRQIFSLMFVYGIVVWIIGFGVAVASGMMSDVSGGNDPAAMAEAMASGPALLVAAVGALLTLIVSPILYCILIVAYYDLRVRKEAFDLDLLASTLEHGAQVR